MSVVRLESLKLTGFKSFPDEVELSFPGSVSAIIGPNGCGKSNLVDAMLWVLGEQSPSLLRLKQMGDVVFSGAAGRKPAGSAEVVLVLRSDDGRWTDTGGRLEVRRRVLRSGPSEYRMNGRVARLKDIVDELLSVGLGMRNYAIIEQGRVGQVLSARPTDRRVLLEEAAGITRYKLRKREAELKLEHTRQNLIRLDDVIDEVTRSLRQLKRQANAAKRFQKMQEELTEVLRELHVSEAHTLAQRREELGRTRARCQNEVAAAASTLGGAEADLVGARKKLEETRAAVESARADVARLDTSRERLETFLERSADLLDTLRTSIDRHRVDAVAASEKRHEVARSLAEAVSGLESCQDALRRVDGEVAEASKEEAEARGVLVEQETLTARRREDLLRTISTLTTSRNRLSELEREQDRLAFSKRQLEQEAERLDVRRGDVGKRHDEAVAHSRTTLEAAAAIEENRARLIEQRAEVREAAQATKTDAESLSHKAWELRHQLSGVERELTSHSAAADRLAELLPDDALQGQVSDSVRPLPEAAATLDRVWRDWLELPVVKADAATSERLLDLGSVDERIQLVVAATDADPLEWPDLEGATPLMESAGFVECARPWLTRTLPPAYVVDDVDRARELAGQHPEALILDPDGILWRGRTAETQAETVTSRGALVLRGERESLVQQIESTTEDAQSSSEKHRGLIADLDGVEAQLAEVDRKAVQVEQERGRAAAVEESLGKERERLEKEIVALAEEQERTRKMVKNLEERRRKIEAEVESLEIRGRELEGAVDEAGETLDGCREAAAERLRRLDRWKAERRLARERQAAAAREEQRLRSEESLLEGQHATLETQRKGLEKELADTENEVVLSRTRLVEEQGSLAAARQHERVEAERVGGMTQKVEELDLEVRRRREAHDSVREQLHNAQIEVGAADGEWARLRDACLADIGATPEILIAETTPGSTASEDLRERSEALRTRLEKMGPVNLLALKEVDELQVRAEFLGTQRADLVASLKSLDETIREIDATCTERFVATFEQVNILFSETFSHLFGGGTARLDLVDEDDPLESGVDVIAQPPGKKNQSVQLLSGGEKALTALALLIALFRIKPSPFCILDEVDAPLDDANVERLAELVKSMTSHTQFVMITHNRRTMQRADVLYGVTMEEAGVSKIVSVRVE